MENPMEESVSVYSLLWHLLNECVCMSVCVCTTCALLAVVLVDTSVLLLYLSPCAEVRDDLLLRRRRESDFLPAQLLS